LHIVDAHTHYWEPDRPERPWDPAGFSLGPQFLIEELLRDASAAGVAQVVQITPSVAGEDNRYALEGPQRYPDRVAAVFGRLNPSTEGAETRLRELASNPAFAGLRFTMFGEREFGWVADGSLDRLLDASAQLGLCVAIFFPQPRELARLVDHHRDCTILVDHMAIDHRFVHRDPSSDAFADWADVLALVKFPNVYVKVSSFPELSRRPFPFDDMLPRVRAVYETFGPDRLIWGSDYPVSKARACYEESVRFFSELAFIPEADKAKIMGGNLLELVRRP
jgi:L-fuconolactonase